MNVEPTELQELRGLVGQAFELRGSPYIFEAVGAIEEWHDRRHVRRLEQAQERSARWLRLLRLLRETAPRSTGRAA